MSGLLREQMEKKQIAEAIREAVENIPNENYKAVVKLKLDGYKLKEIADISGKTEDAVKNDFKRGKHSLKKNLQQMGYIIK